MRTSSLTLADLRVNRGDLFGLFGNDVGAAFGIEWRNEDYFDDRDPRLDGSMPFDTGAIFDESDLVGVSATFDSGASRDTYSAEDGTKIIKIEIVDLSLELEIDA